MTLKLKLLRSLKAIEEIKLFLLYVSDSTEDRSYLLWYIYEKISIYLSYYVSNNKR
jgi:hypothetical protein